jgi:hypothetical protein
MTLLERRLQELETRPVTFDLAEQQRRAARLQHLSTINRFEGIVPSATDERLFQLLAAGKVSKHEYLELCLADALGAA